jgi:glycosyltransferase involved in cell wall biosynthesis
LKIIILQGAFFPVPPVKGGAVEKIWYQMGQQFAALGHEVVHISRSFTGLSNKEVVSGVNYVRVRGYDTPSSLIKLKWLDLLYSARAIKYIPEDADVIVTNTFWSPFFLRGKLGKKVYVSVERVPRGQMKFYQHVGILRGCSPSICETVKSEIPVKSHHLVSYIPNPIPFEVKPTSAERENTILYIGRLHPEKGVHVLIKAFSTLDKNILDKWKLVIVGPSDLKDGGGGDAYLQKLLILSENLHVKFIGPIYKDEELINHYSKAKIFCYPAQLGSGDAAPVAPREAMAYGCVPVVSRLECFNDFIKYGKNGICFDHTAVNQPHILANSLQTLIRDESVLQKLSIEGKLIQKDFSSQVIAKMFIKDFEKIYFEKENESLSTNVSL